MSTQLDLIRDQQQATWDKFSAGWKKWDALVLDWMAPVGAALVDDARLAPDSRVLDIASGTGEPAFTLAAKCPRGQVVMTDLAEKMLEVAKEGAARRGLTNIEARQCDAGALPFADSEFDAVTIRFGHMFFPDVLGATREFSRVVKPGGRVCAAVWGRPELNAWATTVMGAIAKNVDLPAPAPGAPGLFRCAEPGYMTGVFREAGLKSAVERNVSGKLSFESAADYFTFMNDIAAPVVAGMSRADDAVRARIKDEVTAAVAKHASGGRVHLDWSAVLIFGEK